MSPARELVLRCGDAVVRRICTILRGGAGCGCGGGRDGGFVRLRGALIWEGSWWPFLRDEL